MTDSRHNVVPDDGMVIISRPFPFSKQGLTAASSDALTSLQWPVVYIISGKRQAYVGETCNFCQRFDDHIRNPERRTLTEIRVITDGLFNKSATLDIEQSLIRLISSDDRFKLQNKNAGQSASHNYYQRETYQNILRDIWSKFTELGLAKKSYEDIINSAMFAYSPYTALTIEQNQVCNDILAKINMALNQNKTATILVNGAAGTGKTVLAMNMILKLTSTPSDPIIEETLNADDEIEGVLGFESTLKQKHLKIGFLVPMRSLRETLKKVFRHVTGSNDMVIGPSDLTKIGGTYDILFVDETHRLSRYRNIQNRDNYKTTCEALGLETNSTQLDWVLKKSKIQVMFFDKNQTVRGSDIDPEWIKNRLKESENFSEFNLTTQMRCKGGTPFIEYIDGILECKNPERMHASGDFLFEMYENAKDMSENIKALDRSMNLCRMVSGYGWEWKTNSKKKTFDPRITTDFEIDGQEFRWNSNTKGWILSNNAVNEVGCVHSTQGFDLNYVGVIFGPEIDYDPKLNKITVNRDLFFDVNAKKTMTDEEVKTYVLNAYRVLLTRGIHGCLIYVYNNNLRDYMRQFVDIHQDSTTSVT